MADKIRLIVGLGNPGHAYEQTRHNAGAWFVQALADAHGLSWQEEKKFFGLTTQLVLAGESVRLLLPGTFMNHSGQSVAAVSHFYKLAPSSILVAHDELDLAVGVVRLKQGGGHGGHNGLRDTISALGNQQDFLRLRIGIGHPGQARQVVDYVLGKPPSGERQLIDEGIKRSLDVMPDVVHGHFNRAMQALHSTTH